MHTIGELLDQAKCISCSIPEGMQKSILIYLLDQVNDRIDELTIPVTVTIQAFSGNGPPTTQIPANNAGTYFDYANQTLYNWNPSTSSWQ